MNSNNIIINVCMITYNQEPYIRDAIEGVLKQKCNFPIELIIGEDFSTDRTRQICEEYASKFPEIYLLPSETNLGMMGNFIRTLEECTGKYIALCEGDDYWTDPFKLQKQIDFLEANPDFAICFHDVMILKNGEAVHDYITREVTEETDILELAKGNFIHTPSVVFRNKLFKNLPEQFSKGFVGDYFLHLLNAQYGKIKKLKEIMAVYRVHEGGVHSLKTQAQKNDEWLTQLYLMIPCFEGNVKSELIETFTKISKSVILNRNTSTKRQNQIINQIAEFKTDYFIKIIEENDILNVRLNSAGFAVKTIIKTLKEKIKKTFIVFLN